MLAVRREPPFAAIRAPRDDSYMPIYVPEPKFALIQRHRDPRSTQAKFLSNFRKIWQIDTKFHRWEMQVGVRVRSSLNGRKERLSNMYGHIGILARRSDGRERRFWARVPLQWLIYRFCRIAFRHRKRCFSSREVHTS